jgi:hypothetical protein
MEKTMKHTLVRSMIISSAVLTVFAFVQQGLADPVVSLTVGPTMNPTTMDLMGGEANGETSFQYQGMASMEDMWNLTYDMTVDEDPYVSAVFGFQNTSTMTQSFTLNTTLAITPSLTPFSVFGGSIGGSLTDANFDGSATVGTVMGSPMYNGEIDGVGVLPIFAHDTSFTANTFAGETINIPATNVGLPGPSLPGPAANSSIGITHTFTLSPGDKVSFTSFFVAEAIPEPASIGLLGLVSCGIFFTRRRFQI